MDDEEEDVADSELDREGFSPEAYVNDLLRNENLQGILKVEGRLLDGMSHDFLVGPPSILSLWIGYAPGHIHLLAYMNHPAPFFCKLPVSYFFLFSFLYLKWLLEVNSTYHQLHRLPSH